MQIMVAIAISFAVLFCAGRVIRPAVVPKAQAHHSSNVNNLAQDRDTDDWLKYAPSALSEQVQKAKSGNLPKIEPQFRKYFEQPSLSRFQDTLNEEEYHAAENIERVTGISIAAMDVLHSCTNGKELTCNEGPANTYLKEQFWNDDNCVSKERLIRWKNIHRGKDLFIKGLGAFNIKEAYDKALSRRRYWIEVRLKYLACRGCFSSLDEESYSEACAIAF